MHLPQACDNGDKCDYMRFLSLLDPVSAQQKQSVSAATGLSLLRSFADRGG